MLVVHANWTEGALALWAEHAARAQAPAAGDGPGAGSGPALHPFAADAEDLTAMLGRAIGGDARAMSLIIRLPTAGGVPQSSPSLAHAAGRAGWGGGRGALGPDGAGSAVERGLTAWRVPAARVSAAWAARALELLEERAGASDLEEAQGGPDGSLVLVLGDSARFYATAARAARALLAAQRVVPALSGGSTLAGAALSAAWRPWTGDEPGAGALLALSESMPASAAAGVDRLHHDRRAILDDFLGALVDSAARRALASEQMHEAIEGWDIAAPEVAWLEGLLGPTPLVRAADTRGEGLVRTVQRWVGGLEDRGTGGAWRLCLKLSEPELAVDLGDLEAPGDDISWRLSLHLQAVDAESVLVDAEDIWSLRTEIASVKGRRLESPQDLLLRELARAARVCRVLERALGDETPTELELTTTKAYEFLREWRPLLADQGFGVIVPEWWDSPAARVGARLRLDAPGMGADGVSGTAPSSAGPARMGLSALVGYTWEVAVGQTALTLEEFRALAAKRAPLVRVGGRWVEVRPEDVAAAVEFMKENPGGEMRLGDALRLAYRTDGARTGLPILGLEASGWVGDLLDGTGNGAGGARIEMLGTPGGFHGELRPYQARGLSWLAFMDRLGLGPCLADDMGLGKTVQLLALLVHEREAGQEGTVGPTLLVVPMSIVENWTREATRFAPSLKVMVHHGMGRLGGEAFLNACLASHLVVTTYSLVHRDRELLERVPWHRVVLDEAQNIKNPMAKQTQAVRALDAERRIVLTGTPLENRLSELWSIMDFCNPGFMGTMGEFRRFFSVPIERHHDRSRSQQLRSLVRPFVLRRVKTDPTVISDLPAKVETKEFCRLTPEQASLYEACVKQMLAQVEQAEGIRRRGLVLTALIRLKQICNHPAQLPVEDGAPAPAGPPESSRSGKVARLMELLEEVLAGNEQALVFTQFRVMGELLAGMLRHRFDREILLLHGGTPPAQRQAMIDSFQAGGTSAPPVLVLSLKAGGVGLNLTAATHVFHFDRWWNPAVENQATDRAFRIGQTRTVNVHKFVVSGTLEERIDQMIEGKMALAEDVIGAGEAWLTELSTAQLRDVLTLRPDALSDDAPGDEGGF